MTWLRISTPLAAEPEQTQRLRALQQAFAQACNWLAPLVRGHRCWNRVALHHLAYRPLRQAMPALGAQMACNAIYSVCRAARLVYQHPHSPFHHSRLQGQTLPLLRFADTCPVYFDRHTLSLRNGVASLYTLDGRIRFQLVLAPQALDALATMRLREIVLSGHDQHAYQLTFVLSAPNEGAPLDHDAPEFVVTAGDPVAAAPTLPPYLQVEPSHAST
ncbi:hypothetical protein EDC36_109113 [Tepidimonas ignava]|uniref:Transposase n=1 Tax=Tepidimonas ignava TaxID=114249 RepID=A0A4R3LBJ2_9BURK|nr:hypothetical protein EDC36_109113 [Tepidimonas ignava]TSE22096.1 hypothetical protein Tigna_01263 [Tepidimonas ignava]